MLQETKEPNRLEFVIYLRIISMMMIIFFHSLCFYIGTWWYLQTECISLWKVLANPSVKIGLTSFFCLSGFLFGHLYIFKGKYRNSSVFFQNKVKRLLAPYLLWSCILIILMPDIHISWKNILTGPAHLWFLLTLFELFVLIYPLAIILNKKLFLTSKTVIILDTIIIISSFLLLYIWKNLTNHHFFMCIEATLYYLPSFLIGFYWAKYRIIQKKILHAWFFLFIGIFILIFVSYKGVQNEELIYRTPSILVSICTIQITSNLTKTRNMPNIISNLDKNSMGIYILNQIMVFALLIPSPLRLFFCHHPYSGPFIIFIISFALPWLLSYMLNKSKYTAWMLGTHINN